MLIFFAAILQKQILCFWQFYLHYQKKMSLILGKNNFKYMLRTAKSLIVTFIDK